MSPVRRAPIRIAAFVRWSVALAALVCASCGGRSDRRPNIVLVSIDTLVPEALHAYDESAPAHPNLDRFAEQSVVFERAFSTASWTLPSHASLVTGVYSDRHGAVHETLRIDPHVPTIAQTLSKAGYETVGLAEGAFVDAIYGFSAGFERFNEIGSNSEAGRLPLPRTGKYTERPGEQLFDRACAYLSERSSERPFFLFVQTYSVHDYFNARPWAARQVQGVPVKDITYYVECLYGIRQGTPDDWNALRQLYRAEVDHLDRGFGALMAALDEHGYGDDTIVIFVSDHGESLAPELHRLHHGGRLNRDQLHVPLMVRGPGVVPMRRTGSVSLVDVVPTVLELAGLPASTTCDGRSLVSALHGGPPLEDRPLYAHEYNFLWSNGRRAYSPTVTKSPFAVAVIAGDSWFIDNAYSGDELYQRREDPEQRHILYANNGDLQRLRELARARSVTTANSIVVTNDPEQMERLEQLGYVDK